MLDQGRVSPVPRPQHTEQTGSSHSRPSFAQVPFLSGERGNKRAGLSASEIADAPTSFEATRRSLERGIAAVTKKSRPAGCMILSGMLMTSPDHAELAAEFRAERATFRMSLEQRIRRHIESGVLDVKVDAAGLARSYASVLQGISVQAIDGATSAELTDVMKNALNAWP